MGVGGVRAARPYTSCSTSTPTPPLPFPQPPSHYLPPPSNPPHPPDPPPPLPSHNSSRPFLEPLPPDRSLDPIMDMDTTAMVPMNQAQASLLPAPNLSLTGHSAAVYSLSFSPDGSSMCSGSFDKTILLWSIGPYCENHNVLAGHKNAVTQVVWSGSGDRIYSSSADKAVHCYDAMSGELLKRHTSSKGVVNGVAVETGSCNLFASVGDDEKVRLNDARVKRELAAVPTKFANTAVAFSTDNMNVFFGGIDNTVTALDLRQLHAAADDDMMEDGATRVL